MEPGQFCWGARTFLTVLKVYSWNSRSVNPLTIPIYMKCFSQICPVPASKYFRKLFFVSPNFAVIQQYKTETGSSNIFEVSVCLVSAYNPWKDI